MVPLNNIKISNEGWQGKRNPFAKQIFLYQKSFEFGYHQRIFWSNTIIEFHNGLVE